MSQSPLGRETDYPEHYSPELLHGIRRAENRENLGIGADLPFSGSDVWNAWELTWLGDDGKPQAAECEIRVPAASPNIIESKSLKLYLNSFAMTPFATTAGVEAAIQSDLGECTGSDVRVRIRKAGELPAPAVERLPGICIDDENVGCDTWEVDAGLLLADPNDEANEALHSHLLRSLCPVTGQPDSGSILVAYKGPRLDHAGLLRYIVSYRRHQDFHESCVERIFLDLVAECACTALTVYARYQRRGGIDINPYRTNTGQPATNPRLWRQ